MNDPLSRPPMYQAISEFRYKVLCECTHNISRHHTDFSIFSMVCIDCEECHNFKAMSQLQLIEYLGTLK